MPRGPQHQRPLVPDAKPPKADAAPNAKRLEPLLPPADPGLLAQEEMCVNPPPSHPVVAVFFVAMHSLQLSGLAHNSQHTFHFPQYLGFWLG